MAPYRLSVNYLVTIMRGIERLSAVESSTPRMARALPDMPMPPTVMVRLIRISAFGLGNFFEPVFRALATSESEFHVMCLLVAAEHGRAAPSELSELVGTSRANMTRILDSMLSAGWVSRSVDARDGRRHVICITQSGRAKVQDVIPRLVEPLNRAFSGLSASELATLGALLRKAIISFDQSAQAMSAAA